MSKKGRHFFRKMGVTPSVADPGDTHPSDATVGKRNIQIVGEVSNSRSVLFSYRVNRRADERTNGRTDTRTAGWTA